MFIHPFCKLYRYLHTTEIRLMLNLDYPHFRGSRKVLSIASSILLALSVLAGPVHSQESENAGPRSPLDELKTLNGYFPFTVPDSAGEWFARRKRLQQQLQVSLGLWPMPDKTPLNPVVHGKRLMEGYSIEKVYFESFPGYYVTGNLYRPLAQEDQTQNEPAKALPGILCPHGHWQNGRFMWANDQTVKQQLDVGGETFASNARSPIQARCATLAKNGCIVFHYDMIGYADCQQISESVAHRFSRQREKMNGSDRWGFFSPRAEMRSQSIVGLQTWNSIRLLGLPVVIERYKRQAAS